MNHQMLEAERQRLILRLVQQQSVISVAQLVETLGASEATVRRDINALAEVGQLRRIRGGAEALTPRHETHLVGMPFELSLGIAAAQKSAIGRAAVELIKDGESIIINGGTTTYAMVEHLKHRQLDILTNSIAIVSKLLASGRNRVSLPGGTLYREQNIVLSPYENDVIAHTCATKLFTGCYGLNRFGLMEADPLVVQAAIKLLDRAEEIVVLADSRKLRQRSSMLVVGLERIGALVTDAGATEAELEPLRNAGVRIVTVDVPCASEGRLQVTPEIA
jgi:DeoR family ulaG and ulaABCDEF operon transcriptional repressor